MKLNRKMAMVLSLVLSLALATGGTLAYLQDTDSDVNVMTLGNVYIEQLEYERVVENGAWVSMGETDQYGYTPDKLQEYTQLKPLMPAVFADGNIKWDDRNASLRASVTDHQQSWGQIGAPGSHLLFDDSVKNAQDKFVFVKNTGKSDAYVRTWIALEQGSLEGDRFDSVIATNGDAEHWSWKTTGTDVAIDGNEYVVCCVTYLGPKSNPTGILAPDAVSYPSLLQVYMRPEATNEDVKAIDGNQNGTYDILVFSQAVQTAGFADAQTALDEAFGTEHPWQGSVHIPSYGEVAEFNGVLYETLPDAIEAANKAGGIVKLLGSTTVDGTLEIKAPITINGNGSTISRAEGFTGTVFTANGNLTLKHLIVDGAGATATGNLIAAGPNAAIVLDEGTVLKNNHGSHAVNLGTRIGATLTLNGAEISNNSSDSGAIWGGGNITVNEGSKINNNSSTGIGGAIRMVSNCNLTMNGGEISNNTAVTTGGAIYGYGASTYNFNGGKISGNKAATGGAIYTGDSSIINMSGAFEMTGNEADEAGALRLTNRTTLNMTGGKISGNTSKTNANWDGFYSWNPAVNLAGGELADDVTINGGLTPTIGNTDITGVVHFALSTNHNTVNLPVPFDSFRFTVAQGSNFGAFNFKPAAGYTYTAGDENKLICMNDGYSTYWDAATSTFKIKAD